MRLRVTVKACQLIADQDVTINSNILPFFTCPLRRFVVYVRYMLGIRLSRVLPEGAVGMHVIPHVREEVVEGCGRSGDTMPMDSEGGALRVSVTVPAETAAASARLVEVGLRFGLAMSSPERRILGEVEVDPRPGTITLVTGPSGSGKSLLLTQIGWRCPTARMVHNTAFPLDVAVLDAIAPTRPVNEAMKILTACGLGEAGLWIRRFERLSAGEQFRARLARAISLHRRDAGRSPLLCDEFGSLLHGRLAMATAFNLRKLATRERLSLVVATSRDDVETDLRPDTVIRLGGPSPVITRPARASREGCSFSLRSHFRIERGAMRDYAAFSSMHYRGNAEGRIGFVDKVFVCRSGPGGEVLGVVVYARPVLELAPRNRATGGRFVRQGRRLNREMRVLRRLVIHPDVRGCGIGHWLVRRTLPLAGTRFVECLAAMGEINPVFEKAGMVRVGTCEPSTERRRRLAALREAGVDPLRADFAAQVRQRPAVRRLVAESVAAWYRAGTCNGARRLAAQTPTQLASTFRQIAGSAPVYYLWAADEGGWDLIRGRLAADV